MNSTRTSINFFVNLYLIIDFKERHDFSDVVLGFWTISPEVLDLSTCGFLQLFLRHLCFDLVYNLSYLIPENNPNKNVISCWVMN